VNNLPFMACTLFVAFAVLLAIGKGLRSEISEDCTLAGVGLAKASNREPGGGWNEPDAAESTGLAETDVESDASGVTG